MVVAVGLIAAIGPIDPFDGPERLVAYLGLNPSMHQSGECRPRLLDTVGSPSKVEPMRAPCWSKPPGRRFADRGHCAPSLSASAAAAATTSPPSR
jgi:hypothetical protein